MQKYYARFYSGWNLHTIAADTGLDQSALLSKRRRAVSAADGCGDESASRTGDTTAGATTAQSRGTTIVSASPASDGYRGAVTLGLAR